MIRLPLLLALVAVLTGCGGERGHGTATLWVTRDRGAHVVYSGNVPAGLTAIQVLDRKLKLETRYGGRYVQSIDGIEGSLTKHQDWFYFVNGIEGDRSGAEVRLRPGDNVWWDFRSWTGSSMRVPVVVGAFPKPFLGSGHATIVVGDGPVAQKIAKLVGGQVSCCPKAGDYFVIRPGVRVFNGFRDQNGRIGFAINPRDAARLAANPTLARYRYEGLAP